MALQLSLCLLIAFGASVLLQRTKEKTGDFPDDNEEETRLLDLEAARPVPV